HELRMARITAAELSEMLSAGKTPVIFDLRSNAALEQEPYLIQGAIHVSMEEIEKQLNNLPRDREIVVYCSCPNEVSSARLALRLHRKGFTRVRPLLGGLDAWREQKYPMEPRNPGLVDILLPSVKNTEPGHPGPPINPALESVEVKPPNLAKGTSK